MRRITALFLCLTLFLASSLFAAVDPRQQDKPEQKTKKQKKSRKSADKTDSEKKPAPEPKLTERERALHALNRMTFGPRPGDVEHMLAIGVEQWIDQQLSPATDPDTGLDAKLAPLRTLKMQPMDLLTAFPNFNTVRQVAEKKRPAPNDTTMAGLYEVLVDRYNEQQNLNKPPVPAPTVVMTEKDLPAAMAYVAQQQRNLNREGGRDTSGNGNMDAQAETTQGAMGSGEMRMMEKPPEGMFVMPTPAMLPERAQPAPEKTPAMTEEEQRKAAQVKRAEDEIAARAIAEKLFLLPREQRMAALMQMPVHDRRTFANALIGPARDRFLAESTPVERETFQAMNNPTGVVVNELQQGKLLRAIFAQRQLEEVMTDFWYNHFNIFLNKDLDQYLVTSYERDAIRAHALGKFRDLLIATAHHPAMLYYLDNFQSTGPDSLNAVAQRSRSKDPNFMGPGLNENYAREVMELHTLGVDGGYTQQDVTELARILTGWGVTTPDKGSAFEFHPRQHQPGAKQLLGRTFTEDGEREGEQALDLLAKHPATAHFIAKKLAMRFVSDDPPADLVDRMAATFSKTDGDIREVLRTMFHSEEFWSRQNVRTKTKTPLEFVVSAVRATGADVPNSFPLAQTLQRMGMPLYQMQPPTGYKMTAGAWMNSDALIDRLNFAIGLASGKINGVRFDAGRTLTLGVITHPENTSMAGGMDGALALLESALIGGDISETTQATIRKQLADPDVSGKIMEDPTKALSVATGLLLGSPEFQKR